MVDIVGMECCCFGELHGIQGHTNPEDILQDLMGLRLPSGVIFTTIDEKLGDALAAEIVRRKLGPVSYVGPIVNINTGNRVWLYVWKVNQQKWSEQ